MKNENIVSRLERIVAEADALAEGKSSVEIDEDPRLCGLMLEAETIIEELDRKQKAEGRRQKASQKSIIYHWSFDIYHLSFKKAGTPSMKLKNSARRVRIALEGERLVRPSILRFL